MRKKITLEEVIAKASISNKDFSNYNYIETKIENNKSKIIFECKFHGVQKQFVSSHVSGGICRSCYIEKKKTSFGDFVKKANLIHNNKFVYHIDSWLGLTNKTQISCLKHGLFFQSPIEHLRRSGPKCPRCYNRNKDTDIFISESKKIWGNAFSYENSYYTNNYTNISLICAEHDLAFEQKPSNHLAGQAACPKCKSNSSGPEKLWLSYMGVDVRYWQKTIKTKTKLRFVDAFDSETNTVYEFWGDYWHGNPNVYSKNIIEKKSGKTFGQLYEETIQKIKDIDEAGFKLICIWEAEWKALNSTR